ncbi:MAG TPA: stage V sporulation protein S [bacterium]|nr:stage V sporulation protein S [bacterium]
MTLRAAAKTDPKALAGALTKSLQTADTMEIHAVGPHAVNQAMKAIAIARGYLLSSGPDVSCVPLFMRVQIDDQERTALRLIVGIRDLHV